MSEPIYYYLRDNLNAPRITVCLVKDINGNIGRGMAICSVRDQVNKAEGKMIALKRAIKAIYSGKNQLPIYSDNALGIIEYSGINFNILPSEEWKSEYNPELTEYELFLISKRKEKKEVKTEVSIK